MSEETPTPQRPKPGFFSRVFTAKQIEDAEQKAQEEIASDSPAVEQSAPLGVEAPVEAPQKRGVFSRWFGKKEAEAVTAETAKPEPQEELPASAAADASAGWFERLRSRLKKGSGSFVSALRGAIGLSGRLDEETIEQLEEILVASDVSVETALKIIDRLKAKTRAAKTEDPEAVMRLFRETIEEILSGNTRSFEPKPIDGPYIVLVVGVNGVGKTTTIGKMAKRCRNAGLKTMLVAGDTFRAAAVEQLEIWASRNDCDFVKAKSGADPSGLVYDALNTAKSRKTDIVFIDTAGRLQNKSVLMEELEKISRVCGKIIPGAPHETLLVIDGTTGQNAVSQVRAFSSIVPLNGLVMTKLDGTAKGGVLLSIRDQFDIPITLIGVGEGVDDLRDFDPEQFAAALFADTSEANK